MNKKLCIPILLLASVFLVAIVSQAYASKVLFFTPTRVVLSEADKVEVMNVTNLSEITRAYKISLQDLVMTPEGITAPVDTFPYSAKRILRFVPREFTLKPGERQTVRIMARLKSDLADGEYHSHVRFLEDVTQRATLNPVDPNQTQAVISAPMAYETLIPATVSKGKVNVKMDMSNVQVTRHADNTVKVNFKLTREGNGQGIAYVDTLYTNTEGKLVPATPRRTVYIYRELNERAKEYNFKVPTDISGNQSLKIILFDDNKKGSQPVKEVVVPLS